MVAIPMLLYQYPLGPIDIEFIGDLLMLVASILTVLSMIYYLKLAMPHLSE